MGSETIPADVQLLKTSPVFRVTDVEAAAEYYRDRLGFEYSRFWGDPPSFCIPTRDEIHVMLERAEDEEEIRPNAAVGYGWDAYVWVADADALFDEYEAAGARITYEPTIQERYGMKEFAVSDLDGYVLAFGEDVE